MVIPFLAALGPLLASAGGAVGSGLASAGGALASGAGGLAGMAGKFGGLASKLLPGIGSSEIAEGASQGQGALLNHLKSLMGDSKDFAKSHPQLMKIGLGALGGGLSGQFGSNEQYQMFLQSLMANRNNTPQQIGSQGLPGTTSTN